jgi:hypothetical protein
MIREIAKGLSQEMRDALDPVLWEIESVNERIAENARQRGKNEPSEPQNLDGGLLWSQISCVEGRKSIRMRGPGVQIRNSG